jgi:hypothetical protein
MLRALRRAEILKSIHPFGPLRGRLCALGTLEFRERYRRLLIPKYPFGIFYVVETGRFVIHAIMDLRQDPKSIERRLGRT